MLPPLAGLLHPSFLRLVTTWIENSADAPLTLNFSFGGVEAYDPIREDILHRVISQSARWKEIAIKLHIIGDGLVGFEAPITIRCSPCLTLLKLHMTMLERSPLQFALDLSTCTSTNQETSQLSEIVTSGVLIWRLPEAHHTLHLPNLRNLNFRVDLGTELCSTLRVLSASPNLSSLQIYDDWSALAPSSFPLAQNQDEIPEVTLNNLSSLNLSSYRGAPRYASQTTMMKLIDKLTCPSLGDFNFHTHKLLNAQHWQSFTSFFTRQLPMSGSPLVKLSLYFPGNIDAIPPESLQEHSRALVEMLRLVNKLEYLSLWGFIANDELLGALTILPHTGMNNGSEILCPSLSGLCVFNKVNIGMSEEAAEEMVVSRWESGCRLRRLSLRMPGLRNLGNRSARMKALVQEGLVIYY